MKQRRLRLWIAYLLLFALCFGLAVPAFAVSEQVQFTGVDTIMIYNPMVSHKSGSSQFATLSTGDMTGQIKIAKGNFDLNGSAGESDILYWEEDAQLWDETGDFIPAISASADEEACSHQLQSAVSVGTTKSFFYWPDYGAGYKEDKADFTCLYAGDRCIVWGYEFPDETIAEFVGQQFDEVVYPNNTAYFGTGRFMDNGGRLNILIYDMNYSGVAGFFWGAELYTAAEQGSNAGKRNAGEAIVHINAASIIRNLDTVYGSSTVAHEYQHLICLSSALLGNGYSHNFRIDNWLDEGMATEAAELNYPGTIERKGFINSYNYSLHVSGGQSLYNFDTKYDIGVYGQGFLFAEYIKLLNGGTDIYKEIHDYWRTAEATELAEAKAIYAAMPQSVRTAVLDSVSYPDSVTEGFSGEEVTFLSKLALAFHLAAVLKEDSGIYGMTQAGAKSNPMLYTDDRNHSTINRNFSQCWIESGGRIIVRTMDGNSYTVPADASDKLIYVGFKDGEIVIPPTTAADYAASISPIRAESNNEAYGSVALSGSTIVATPVAGCGYAIPAYEVISGSARVEQIGNVFLIDSPDGCTVRILFEQRKESFDVWDGSVAESVPISEGMYVISTCAQLAKLAEMVNAGDDFAGKTVRLASHLDLNGLAWTPIGCAENSSFRGVFDANGYTVMNLSVGSEQEPYGACAGLFGYLGSDGALVRNLILEDVSVYGSDCAGGLVGRCEGSVSDSQASGFVSGTNDVGLLLGKISSGDVIRCASLGTVSASGERVGGLVGSIADSTGESADRIINCYSCADVSGKRLVGGLLGQGHSGLAVSNCYWAGSLSAEEMQGGIAGDPGDAVCSGCIYSSQGSSFGAGDGTYPGVSARTMTAMRNRSTYSGWDFDYVWRFFISYGNGGLPVLIWQRLEPTKASSDITFDKANFIGDSKVLFNYFGSQFLGVEGVDPQYVKSVCSEPYTVVILAKEYLYSLPVGNYTMYALFSGGYRVPFSVRITDSTGGVYKCQYQSVSYTGDSMKLTFLVSAPEVREVMLVVAVYRDGRMVDVETVIASVKHGKNYVSVYMEGKMQTDCSYAAYLVAAEGFDCLTKNIWFA